MSGITVDLDDPVVRQWLADHRSLSGDPLARLSMGLTATVSTRYGRLTITARKEQEA